MIIKPNLRPILPKPTFSAGKYILGQKLLSCQNRSIDPLNRFKKVMRVSHSYSANVV